MEKVRARVIPEQVEKIAYECIDLSSNSRLTQRAAALSLKNFWEIPDTKKPRMNFTRGFLRNDLWAN